MLVIMNPDLVVSALSTLVVLTLCYVLVAMRHWELVRKRPRSIRVKFTREHEVRFCWPGVKVISDKPHGARFRPGPVPVDYETRKPIRSQPNELNRDIDDVFDEWNEDPAPKPVVELRVESGEAQKGIARMFESFERIEAELKRRIELI